MGKKNGEERKRGQRPAAFEGAQVRGAERKGAGGPGGHRMEGDSLGSRHQPPAGVRGRHHCRATGEGGGGRVTLA
jgi:hypothetical protein